MLVDVGRACLKYTGSFNYSKLPASLQVWELGAYTDDDCRRLQALDRIPGLAKVGVSCWALDPATARVWKSRGWRPQFPGRGYLQRVLREPRMDDRELARLRAPVGVNLGPPRVTQALLGVLALAFVAEWALSTGPSHGLLGASLGTLVALGALGRPLVLQHHEWHRLLTSAFLHGDLIHLGLNGLALYMAGNVIENLMGRAWPLALFFVGALGGALMSSRSTRPESSPWARRVPSWACWPRPPCAPAPPGRPPAHPRPDPAPAGAGALADPAGHESNREPH